MNTSSLGHSPDSSIIPEPPIRTRTPLELHLITKNLPDRSTHRPAADTGSYGSWSSPPWWSWAWSSGRTAGRGGPWPAASGGSGPGAQTSLKLDTDRAWGEEEVQHHEQQVTGNPCCSERTFTLSCLVHYGVKAHVSNCLQLQFTTAWAQERRRAAASTAHGNIGTSLTILERSGFTIDVNKSKPEETSEDGILFCFLYSKFRQMFSVWSKTKENPDSQKLLRKTINYFKNNS